MGNKKLKAYIAGPLALKQDREFLKKIDALCNSLDINTFLPHRDVGLWKNIEDTKRIAQADLRGFNNCNLLIANMNGFGISSGTAWEMGYAYAKNIPVIGIKTDKKVSESIEDLSAIIIGLTKITTNFEELKKEIQKCKIKYNKYFEKGLKD